MKKNNEIKQSHFNSIVFHVLYVSAIFFILSGCKKKDQVQDVQEQEPAKQTQDVAVIEQNELIGPDGKIKLRILCTTSPEEGRTDDFVNFLSEHFIKVETTGYEDFHQELAQDFDVVIIDYGAKRPGTPTPQLSRDYSRATVTMGVSGSMVCRKLNLKPGYL